MSNKVIRLTESDLHRIVKESVDRIIQEGMFDAVLKHIPGTKTCKRYMNRKRIADQEKQWDRYKRGEISRSQLGDIKDDLPTSMVRKMYRGQG